MAKNPITAIVMHPMVRDEILRDDHLQRLDRSVKLITREPIGDLEKLGNHLDTIEVLITSWGCTRIDATLLDKMPKLKLVAHIAGSVKGFLDDAVWRKGVLVTNAVAANAVPVAEYTLAAIIFSNKKVFQLNSFYLENRENRAPWNREAPNAGNYKKTVGIIGASHVGRLVIQYLNNLEIKILLYDPFIGPIESREIGAIKVGLTELLSQSDIVSLHAPLLQDTRNMLGAYELSLMKTGATLINTARGDLVDPEALEIELINGRLHAILDTTSPDVLPPNSPIYDLANVFLTPHIAGSLGDETQRLADYIVEEVERYSNGQSLKYRVRREQLPHLA
tara:strand:+ start:2484 stop:3491 length:1008 start_codon:yes stop_codon:yes gene_type:complete